MHIRKVFEHLLRLQGVRVTGVEYHVDAFVIFVDVVATGRGRACSRCHRRSLAGIYDSKPGRLWRHLDLGPWSTTSENRRAPARISRPQRGKASGVGAPRAAAPIRRR